MRMTMLLFTMIAALSACATSRAPQSSTNHLSQEHRRVIADCQAAIRSAEREKRGHPTIVVFRGQDPMRYCKRYAKSMVAKPALVH